VNEGEGTLGGAEQFYASLARKRIGSGALITDPRGRVLMVEPTYKSNWEVPGGAVESEETAYDACRRECREELGLEIDVGRLLVIEHQCDGGHRGDSIMFIYDCGVLPDDLEIRLPSDELRSFRFVDESALEEVAVERLTRRLRYALLARTEGRLIELVDGRPTVG
jgi:ADP-ribose pyrophosphatase YjhB (NUDIX family)